MQHQLHEEAVSDAAWEISQSPTVFSLGCNTTCPDMTPDGNKQTYK